MALNTILSAILELSSVDMWYGFASVLPEYKNPRSRLHWGGIPVLQPPLGASVR